MTPQILAGPWRLIAGLWMLIFFLLIGSGIKEFSLWYQVEYFWERGGLGLGNYLIEPHWLRYQLVSPLYHVSTITGFAPNDLFSRGLCAVSCHGRL